ncbi:MAG: endolytic transglycosylase MltG [Firmicutes bacterium]|nr:endolytic transglycosylase MltG [Bacillota bacterium]
MRKFLIVLLLLIVIAGAGGLWYVNNLDKPKDPASTEEITIEIPEGTYASTIGEILEKNGVINSAFNFKLYLKMSKTQPNMKSGTFTLSPSMDFATIIETLETSQVSDTFVTIPEGLTIEQTAQKLADQGAGTYEGFMDAIENGSYDYGFLKNNSLEGYLMPDTYSVPDSYDEHDIIDMILQHFGESIADLYESTDNEITQNYTLNEVLTAASIIERECMVDDERPLVSSVIYNRINNNMMLQMCSTVQYLLLKETGEVKDNLLYEDLEIDSPYNTYKHYGLPPGPICSMGLKSFKAALEPADTNYLYFVLSEKLDGTSNFTGDYNEFVQFEAAYNKAYTEAHSG